MTEFVDRQLVCRECGKSFLFSAGEQQFFHAKRLQNDPGRCLDCRAAYKARTMQVTDRPTREMHAAVCASCEGQAMIPFVPRNDRPVYCSSCFDHVREATINAAALANAQIQ